ncbi:MAG: hypothetical protein WCI11_03400 [Candidatus Methylumidiphilus sp.]
MKNDGNDSAGHALRGFRLQILYTLARLIEPQATLRPEGIEDLAIYDINGELREAIQVKGYTEPLTLSDLISKNGQGLLTRAVQIAHDYPDCNIHLLSFGPFGKELLEAWNGDCQAREQVVNKLKRTGLKPSDINLLFEKLKLIKVSEEDIVNKIRNFLGTMPNLAGQPEHAMPILRQWLYDAAERREQIKHSDLIARLAGIGRYLHAREGYWRDWFSVIEPIEQTTEVESQRERLNAQFQQGMSVRYEHILAGCDVRRNRWLDQITQGFSKENVVIVHGASGQGKSSLAYRWLHDETPKLWRFEIKLVETRRDALQIATMLSAHARAVGVPMTIYIDVRPGDRAWAELVQELSRLPQIRILVTIREEDWRRTTLSGATVTFTDISLTLDQEEAKDIYRLLERPNEPTRFLSFEDAWHRFVGSASNDGPLMEFVYLVTRIETLHERLSQQIRDIRDEVNDGKVNSAELRLLALVAFASAFGARLDVAIIRKNLALPDLGRSVERLEREYLLRITDEGLLLDGLHPVRSRILKNILCDGMTFDAQELALECLDLIPSQDIEVFLLYLASRQTGFMPIFIKHLNDWQPKTWAAHGGILHALLWWGVREYIDQMTQLVDEIRDQIGTKAWLIILDLDIAELIPPYGTAIWKQLEFFNDEQKSRFQALTDRQPPKSLAQMPVRKWLASINTPPLTPSNENDWIAIAELSYWIGHWSIDVPLRNWLLEIDITPVLEEIPLSRLADLFRSRWELDREQFSPWLIINRETVLERFRREANTPWIEDQDGTVRAHFLVPWAEILTDEQKPDDDYKNKDRLHAEGMKRVMLLRGLYPERQGFGCQGYGHHIFPVAHDSTTKTSIKAEILHPAFALQVNRFANSLIDWQYRPQEWSDYLSQIWVTRENLLAVMQDLRRALIAHFRDKHKREAIWKRLDSDSWYSLKSNLDLGILLPRQTVDEWGFISEGLESSEGKSNSVIEQGFAIAQFKNYLKFKLDLFQGIHNFINQAEAHLQLQCAEGKAGIEFSRLLIENIYKCDGRQVVDPYLTTSNLSNAFSALLAYQREFRRHFKERFSNDQLDKQDRLEHKAFYSVLPLWKAYLAHPTEYWPNPEQRVIAIERIIDRIPQQLLKALQELSSEGIKANLIKELKEWENKPAIWFVLDSEDPVQMLSATLLAITVIHKTILKANLSREQYLALQHRWENIVIISVLKGRSFDKSAKLIPIQRFVFEDILSELEWLDDISRPIKDEIWKRTSLKYYSTNEIEHAKQLMLAIVSFEIMADHLSGWIELAQHDEADREVLQIYINRYQGEWSEIVQAFINAVAAVTNKFNDLSAEDWEQRPFLLEAVTFAKDHYQFWLPPGLDKGQAKLNVDGCKSWLTSVTDHINELHTFAAAVLIDAIVLAST